MLTVEQKITVQLNEADIEEAIKDFICKKYPETDNEDFKIEVKSRAKSVTVTATKTAKEPIIEPLTEKQEEAVNA